MEAIIGVGGLVVDGLVDLIGGTEIAESVGSLLTSIIDTLEEDGFASLQNLMKNFSENDLYNVINSVEGSYPEIYIGRSLKLGGMSPTEVLSDINTIGAKFAKKGIDIASTKGKQLFIDIVDQVGQGLKNNAIPIIASGAAGLVGQTVANKIRDQNDNKVDYNNYVANGGDSNANTLANKL